MHSGVCKGIKDEVNKFFVKEFMLGKGFYLGEGTYRPLDILGALFYCAFHNQYFESGLKEYKFVCSNREMKIPDADTVNRRINSVDWKVRLSEFEQMIDAYMSILRSKLVLKRGVVLLIDMTELPYWGDKNDFGIVGTKRQRGTSYAYRYITAHALIGDLKMCISVLPVFELSDTAELVDRLITFSKRYVEIGLVLMDRGFANSRVIRVLEKHKVKYLAPITKNERIRNDIKDMYWNKRDFNGNTIIKYKFKDGTTTTVFFTQNKTKENSNNICERYFVWCTNLEVTTETRNSIADMYSQRWNIETFYRDAKRNFLIKTKSKNYPLRLFIFLFAAVLYNLWKLFELIMNKKITAHQWKIDMLKVTYILNSTKQDKQLTMTTSYAKHS